MFAWCRFDGSEQPEVFCREHVESWGARSSDPHLGSPQPVMQWCQAAVQPQLQRRLGLARVSLPCYILYDSVLNVFVFVWILVKRWRMSISALQYCQKFLDSVLTYPPVDIMWAIIIVRRISVEIIRIVLCFIVHNDTHTHTWTVLTGECWLWSPYVIGQTIIFSCCGLFFFFFLFFPRLISAAADWMSAILPHMVWP